MPSSGCCAHSTNITSQGSRPLCRSMLPSCATESSGPEITIPASSSESCHQANSISRRDRFGFTIKPRQRKFVAPLAGVASQFDLDTRTRFLRNFTSMKITTASVLIVICFVCAGPLANIRAVSPPPDGDYPGGNTAEGQEALSGLTSGGYNTAVGWLSLATVSTGDLNTGVGAGTLLFNTADGNTATGAAALFSTTSGFGNTANGSLALAHSLATPQAATTQVSGGKRSFSTPPAKAMSRSVAAHSPTVPPAILT